MYYVYYGVRLNAAFASGKVKVGLNSTAITDNKPEW